MVRLLSYLNVFYFCFFLVKILFPCGDHSSIFANQTAFFNEIYEHTYQQGKLFDKAIEITSFFSTANLFFG